MRLILVAGGLLVLGLGALIMTSPSEAPSEAKVVEATVTMPSDPYGAALGGGQAPVDQPAQPATTTRADGDGGAVVETTSGAATSTTTATTPTSVTLDESTTVIDDEVEPVHAGGGHSEEEPEDEFPGLAEGEFPITSNLDPDVAYPLEAMVELAVDVLRAEVTGEGRELYPHLVDMVSVCCEVLEIDGAAVLFGTTQADPATIIMDWHADAAGSETRIIRGSTQTRWWWVDGTWLGEFELPEGLGS